MRSARPLTAGPSSVSSPPLAAAAWNERCAEAASPAPFVGEAEQILLRAERDSGASRQLHRFELLARGRKVAQPHESHRKVQANERLISGGSGEPRGCAARAKWD